MSPHVFHTSAPVFIHFRPRFHSDCHIKAIKRRNDVMHQGITSTTSSSHAFRHGVFSNIYGISFCSLPAVEKLRSLLLTIRKFELHFSQFCLKNPYIAHLFLRLKINLLPRLIVSDLLPIFVALFAKHWVAIISKLLYLS